MQEKRTRTQNSVLQILPKARVTTKMQSQRKTSSLNIRLFGSFAVCIGGQPLPPLHSRKGHSLLALLTLRHEREVQRDWLAGTLWPESMERQALHNLRQTLSNLRQ